MRIGRYEATAVLANRFRLDGGAMFGSVPKTLWSKEQPPDDLNRISLACRLLLLRGAGRCILIDTGCGTKFSPKEAEIYGLDPTLNLDDALAGAGVRTEDVTDVVLSHLHFDHCGGNTRHDPSVAPGQPPRIVPSFPRASYHVQQKNWETAMAPNLRERASYLAENFMPVQQAGRFCLINGEVEFLPGLRATLSHGHTQALQVVEVVGGEGEPSLFYVADLMPTVSHLKLPYVMGYDLHALWVMEEKAKLLDRVTASQSFIFFEHDPHHAAVRVKKGAKYHEVVETATVV